MQLNTFQFDLPDGRTMSAHLVTDGATATLQLTLGTESVELDARQRETLDGLHGITDVLAAATRAGISRGLLR